MRAYSLERLICSSLMDSDDQELGYSRAVWQSLSLDDRFKRLPELLYRCELFPEELQVHFQD